MKNKILCIGEILWDLFPEGVYLGGAPFNAAFHLHQLGEKVKFISRIGSDKLGKDILLQLKKMGMDNSLIQIDERYPTGIVNVYLDKSNNATYNIMEPAAWDFIQPENSIEWVEQNVNVVIFGSLALRNSISKNTIKCICKKKNLKVFDINLRSPYHSIKTIEEFLFITDILKLNEEEIKILSEWFNFSSEIKQAAFEICEYFHCSTICITKGPRGASLLFQNEWFDHPGFYVKTVDTVGAGDAFLAAFIKGYIAQQPPSEILDSSNAIGAYVAGKKSATPIIDFYELKLILDSKSST